jgi:15-cis-phytoene desaturase
MAINNQDVIIIGSGLAGLSAAIYCQEAGLQPLVLERNHYVGGRTSSWDEHGMDVESGLHRYLGFYSELPKLLRKAGLKLNNVVDWEDQLEIRVPHGPTGTFGVSLVHKPLKTIAGAFGNNEFLTVEDKTSLARFFAAGLKDYVTRPEFLDTQTVQQYAQSHGVTKQAIDRLLVAITEGLFFLSPRIYSAYAFFGLIGPYWKKLPLLRVGGFAGGMSRIMSDPLADYIREQGGQVMTSQTVSKIKKATKGFEILTSGGDSYNAKAVILAASLYPAKDIIQNSFKDPWFEPMLKLMAVPSVTMQLELSEPALPIDRVTFGPMTCLGSFTEQSRTTFKDKPGRFSIILTPPERFIHMHEKDVLNVVISEARSLGIELEDKIVNYRKISIPYDFYLLSPGADRLRPSQKTSIDGLYLAGDYTKQKFLTTMEGAVYSGKIAANLAADYINK